MEDYLTLLSLIPSCFDSVLDYETNKINEGLFLSDTQADTLIADLNTFCDNSSEHYLITVSYTHLDVYKRQLCWCNFRSG